MTIVEKKVRTIRWRLEWLNFCQRFVRLFLVALVLMTLYLIATKLVGLSWAFSTVVSWLAGATIPLALVRAILTRTTRRDAAIATDQKLALRERLSTALAIGPPRTPMETAVAADAEAYATPLCAHRVFPMPMWRDLYSMSVPVLVMALVGMFVPQFDLLGKKEKESESPLPTQAQKQLAKRLDGFQRELDKMTTTAPPVQVRELSSDMEQLLRDLRSQRRLSRTDVLKSLSRMSDRFAERKSQLEKKMAAARKVERFRSGQLTEELTDALAKGNFEQAKAEIANLGEKIKQADSSKQERDKLSAELKGLSEALADNPKLSDALAQAAKNLNAGDLDSALSDLQLSAEQLQDLLETLQQMAELDQIDQYLQKLRACQGCSCGTSGTCAACTNYAALLAEMGKFRTGDTNRFGSGMGGRPGRGVGGRLKMEETPTQFKPTKTRMKLDKGDIIGVVRVWGPQVKGEATAKFEEAYVEYHQSAEDTLARENIPLEYRTLVRDYFDAIRPATMAKKSETPPTEENKNDE